MRAGSAVAQTIPSHTYSAFGVLLGIDDDAGPLNFAEYGLPQTTSEHASQRISMCALNALNSADE